MSNKNYIKMKKTISILLLSFLIFSCTDEKKTEVKKETSKQANKIDSKTFPKAIILNDIAQNPEGIEFDKNDNTFLLSSLNALPIAKVNLDGTFKPFTSGEKFPLSTAGLEIDYKRNRLLVAGFNGTELMDNDPKTKGVAFLRIYNLKTGILEKDINLSSLIPDASAYFANDIAVDGAGNTYISDWYARVIYKVDIAGNASVFWKNETGVPSGPNGLDFHSDGYLLVSVLSVNEKGLYTDYGLVKIAINNPKAAKLVAITDAKFTGFDGMILNTKGNVIGVTNNGTTPGGNTLIELSSKNNWESAEIVNTKAITASTTVAIAPKDNYYVINQDFSNDKSKTWTIAQIEF
jgi:sugar lactone lactonase YvrE